MNLVPVWLRLAAFSSSRGDPQNSLTLKAEIPGKSSWCKVNWIDFKAASVWLTLIFFAGILKWYGEHGWQYKKYKKTPGWHLPSSLPSKAAPLLGQSIPVSYARWFWLVAQANKNSASTASLQFWQGGTFFLFESTITSYNFYIRTWAHESLGSRAEQIRNKTWNLWDSTNVNVYNCLQHLIMIAMIVTSQYLTLGSKLPIRQLHHGSRFCWTYSAVLPESNVLFRIWDLGVTSD